MVKSICHQIFDHSICVIGIFQLSNLMTKRWSKLFSHLGWQPKVIENWQLKFLSIVGKNSSNDQNVLGNDKKNSIVGLMAIVNRTINVCLFRHIQMDGCNFGASCWFWQLCLQMYLPTYLLDLFTYLTTYLLWPTYLPTYQFIYLPNYL